MTQQNNGLISKQEREAVYRTIYGRRDVRSYFKPDPISSDVLARILRAAHHAGSVGYMQPWNFIVVEDTGIRERVRKAFLEEREEASALFDEKRREKYLSYKLEGILEASVNLIVTCDSSRFGPQVIGRHSMPETDAYSTVCAIQNLWLAARAENVGVGWVSILKHEDVHRIFNIPETIRVVAYLCLGYVTQFPDKPDFESLGWNKRTPLEDLVYFDKWHGTVPEGREDLIPKLKEES